MEDVAWHWVGTLALIGLIALSLAFRFPHLRWPRTLAVTAALAIGFLLFVDANASRAIVIVGAILSIMSAAAQRK